MAQQHYGAPAATRQAGLDRLHKELISLMNVVAVVYVIGALVLRLFSIIALCIIIAIKAGPRTR